MNKQNLIIFKLKTFYNVLKELESVINFEIFEATNEEQCKELQNKLDNYMVIISQKNQNFSRALNLEKFPIEIFKFIEKVNIQSLKHQYQDKSEINLGKIFPENWGLQVPLSMNLGEEFLTPEYDPFYQDILLKDRMDSSERSTQKDSIKDQAMFYTKRKSVNLIGVRKNSSGKSLFSLK